MRITGSPAWLSRNILRNLSLAAKNTSMSADQNEGVMKKKSKILHSLQCVEPERIARCIADLLQLSHFGTRECVSRKNERKEPA
jgi:hypothetical protein